MNSIHPEVQTTDLIGGEEQEEVGLETSSKRKAPEQWREIVPRRQQDRNPEHRAEQ